ATSDREGIRTKHSTQETALNTLSPDEKQDEVGDELAASASHNQGIMSKATDTIQEGCPLSERRNLFVGVELNAHISVGFPNVLSPKH
ncbi:hypothetical protein Tco_0276482, partial [Tanacetum coccineum]